MGEEIESSSADMDQMMSYIRSIEAMTRRLPRSTAMENEANTKLGYFAALNLLRNEIRRTDAEMRHLTHDKDLKEFETDILRINTLIRATIAMAMALEVIEDFATGGATTPQLLMSLGMLGLAVTTSAGVMTELS
jgi:hypothetical protein